MKSVSEHRQVHNPVFRARRMATSNVIARLGERPLLAAACILVGLMTAAITLAAARSLIARHAAAITEALARWPAPIWLAIALLCLGWQLPLVRRTQQMIQHSWLAALPQMPRAMVSWQRAQAATVALSQIAILMTILALAWNRSVLTVSSATPHIVLCILVPVAMMVGALWLCARTTGMRHAHSIRPKRSARSASRPRSVPRTWQWANYRHKQWDQEARWSLGFLLLLVPAGAGPILVAAIGLIGVLLIQWQRFWSASLKVIPEASALTRALPQRPGRLIGQLLPLVILASALLPSLLSILLFALGLPLVSAIVVGIATWAVLLLHAACVLAWRLQPRWAGWRSAGLLLGWVSLSQAIPWAAPLFWLITLAGLIRRSLRMEA